jgi:hypothetical protein
MKSAFYDRAVTVVSYTAIRLSCKFHFVVGADFPAFLCFFGKHR